MQTKTAVGRRDVLRDAAIEVIAREGSRGLTHRAVDEEAKLPQGSTSNYFRTREALLAALAERIDERLRPDLPTQERLARAKPSRARYVTLMQLLVQRVLAQPSLHVALFELKLEATRRPALRAALRDTLARNFEADLAFHERAGLPGGRRELTLLHAAFDGLLLDQLTTGQLATPRERRRVVRALVEAIVPRERG
jgi:DNA-binding transcriptional regulator YbjK